jgi:phosphatidylserine/phosphatidylglycerophosphate/cardiolipin synthase-like enzyme
VLALGLGYYLWQRGDLRVIGIEPPAPTAVPTPLPIGSGEIQPFFTTPYLVYPDQEEFRRPSPFEQALIADIDSAQRSVDMVTFEYNLDSVAQALVRAAERGVQVRLALDLENLEKPEMAEWAGMIEEARIPIAWENSDAFLHSKFLIIDDRLVWMGSWNTTVNDTYRNNNNLLRISVPEIVANYRAEFTQMFEFRDFNNDKEAITPHNWVEMGGWRIENYFTPIERPIVQMVSYIEQAQQSVKFMAFAYTSDGISNAMIARSQAGIPVQGVFENRNINGTGSRYQAMVDGGIEVLPDGNCYTMHHKVIIIDDRIVITGSYNFTGRAADVNDENVIILDNPDIVAEYVAEFERVYNQARNPLRCG